jgi:hypothetical protein
MLLEPTVYDNVSLQHVGIFIGCMTLGVSTWWVKNFLPVGS